MRRKKREKKKKQGPTVEKQRVVWRKIFFDFLGGTERKVFFFFSCMMFRYFSFGCSISWRVTAQAIEPYHSGNPSHLLSDTRQFLEVSGAAAPLPLLVLPVIMLNSRKGNLSCFQWEVERFQQSHREKMAAVTPQTHTRPTAAQQHRGGLRKRLARERLAEIQVQKRNALIVERMTEIHRVGGFQRRCVRHRGFQHIANSCFDVA